MTNPDTRKSKGVSYTPALAEWPISIHREDLSKIPYLTMCLKEAMRLHSPVPIIGRETTREFELDGVTIPPGTFISIFLYLLHHNDEVWGPNHWVSRGLYTDYIKQFMSY